MPEGPSLPHGARRGHAGLTCSRLVVRGQPSAHAKRAERHGCGRPNAKSVHYSRSCCDRRRKAADSFSTGGGDVVDSLAPRSEPGGNTQLYASGARPSLGTLSEEESHGFRSARLPVVKS